MLALDLRPPVLLDLWPAATILGIVLGTVAPPVAATALLAALVVSAGAGLWEDLVPGPWRLMALLSPLFVGVGVGVALLHASAPDPLARLAALEPERVVVEGRISSPPEAAGFGHRAELGVESLWYGGQEALRGGAVELFAPGLGALGMGDEVRAEGRLYVPEPSPDFDYARYLATLRVSAVMEAEGIRTVGEGRGWIGELHRRTDRALGYGLRPEEASVVRGMVLGDRSLIPESLEEAFRRSGITHILAISGQHVAVLTAAAYFVLRAFAMPAAARVAGTLSVIWLYIVVAGAPPSAIRAGVAATLFLLGTLLGRPVSPLHLAGCMLVIILSYNPLLLYNTGFQLSVAAVLGILLLRRPIEDLLRRLPLRLPRAVTVLVSVSLAAQLATAPVVAASFGEVSLVGVVTNLVAVPLSGPVLVLGLLAAVAGNVLPALAYPLNLANGALVSCLSLVAKKTASMPWAAVSVPDLDPHATLLLYAGFLPAAICGGGFARERGALWAAVALVWTAGWVVFARLSGG
ncbi:ComEC/Rec2 family competence protein [Rubrobacter xylanophilus]|uniref:ComEC/Rec2 family competence protein n=1 Tax=Rubrobacter xylanophilus TaxID=49319 RepID=UPI001A7E84D1|nr:ComEC/Rec2 family competence protein [Rubrobacter xylanophilus]